MLDRSTTIRRVALIVLIMLTFFVSILEPLTPSSMSENVYKSKPSSFEGIPDEPLDLGANQNFCKAFNDSNVKIEIEFTVKITTLKKRNTNIFQTDDLNMGFRIEISPDGKLNAFVQSPDGGGPEKVLSVMASDIIKAKALTKVHVTAELNTLTVQVNDGELATREGNFQPTCNHVLIGGGYDGTRTAIGEVQAAVRIQTTRSVVTFGLPMRTRGIARVVFTFLIFALAWDYRKKLFVSNDKGVK